MHKNPSLRYSFQRDPESEYSQCGARPQFMGHRSYKIDCYQITLDRRVNRGHNCFMVEARSSIYFILINRTDLLDVSRGLCSEVCIKSGYKIGVIYS